MHFNPPYLGTGLSQERDRVCNPSPQDFEHWDHGLHSEKFPFTEKVELLFNQVRKLSVMKLFIAFSYMCCLNLLPNVLVE